MAPCKIIDVSVDYSFYERMNIMLNDFGANIENSEFTDKVNIRFSLKESLVDNLGKTLTEQSNGKYVFDIVGEKFAKI